MIKTCEVVKDHGANLPKNWGTFCKFVIHRSHCTLTPKFRGFNTASICTALKALNKLFNKVISYLLSLTTVPSFKVNLPS